MRRKVYSKLVGTIPIREVAGTEIEATLQDLPSAAPSSAIMVPQSDSDIADRERRLLLIDAAITPPKMPGAYGLPTWAVDCARLMRAAHHAKLPGYVRATDAEFDKVREAYMEASETPIQQAARAQRLALTADSRLNGILSVRLRKRLKPVKSWKDVIKLAGRLAELAKDEKPLPPKGQAQKQSGDNGNGGEPAEQHDGPMVGQSQWRLPPIERKGGEGLPGVIDNLDQPDQLAMQSLRKRGMRKRPELEGAVPSAWHRLPLDQKLFKGAPMRGGNRGRGTVLVDMSGSMSWEASDVRALLEQLPECTILGYCGHRGHGRLVLLADRGAAATQGAILGWLKSQRQGNCIDAPALELLARMPGPRLWVSDGGVTDAHDCYSGYVNRRCRSAMKHGNIWRVGNGKAAARYLAGDLSCGHQDVR